MVSKRHHSTKAWYCFLSIMFQSSILKLKDNFNCLNLFPISLQFLFMTTISAKKINLYLLRCHCDSLPKYSLTLRCHCCVPLAVSIWLQLQKYWKLKTLNSCRSSHFVIFEWIGDIILFRCYVVKQSRVILSSSK